MSYRLELRLLGVPTPERNARRHWRTSRKEIQAWRRAVAFGCTGRLPPKPIAHARVVFTRHGERTLDFTNLVDSFKAIEDGLVRAGVLVDDKPENFTGGHADYRQEPAPRAAQFVTITVTEESPTDAEDPLAHAHGSSDEEERHA